MKKETKKVVTAAVTAATTVGGWMFANRIGRKVMGDEKIGNPIEALGYIGLTLGAAGLAGNTAKTVMEAAITTDDEDEEDSDVMNVDESDVSEDEGA